MQGKINANDSTELLRADFSCTVLLYIGHDTEQAKRGCVCVCVCVCHTRKAWSLPPTAVSLHESHLVPLSLSY